MQYGLEPENPLLWLNRRPSYRVRSSGSRDTYTNC